MIDEQRTRPVLVGDERATLTSVLQWQRDTLMMKCAGLTDEQLRRKAVAPSGLSLLGLVRHLAEVERSWFRNVLNDEDVRGYFPKNEAGESGRTSTSRTRTRPSRSRSGRRRARAPGRSWTPPGRSM